MPSGGTSEGSNPDQTIFFHEWNTFYVLSDYDVQVYMTTSGLLHSIYTVNCKLYQQVLLRSTYVISVRTLLLSMPPSVRLNYYTIPGIPQHPASLEIRSDRIRTGARGNRRGRSYLLLRGQLRSQGQRGGVVLVASPPGRLGGENKRSQVKPSQVVGLRDRVGWQDFISEPE